MKHLNRRSPISAISAISAAVIVVASFTLAGCDRTPNTIKLVSRNL